MSTTVTYKGETLTTVNNTTKTLETKGTWLEDDIELTDVSGGGSTLITKSISANGTYNASSDSADGYSQVTVAVPNSYSAGDEGKVVSNGALVSQTSDTVTQNDTYDTTLINRLTVNVSGGGSSVFTEYINGVENILIEDGNVTAVSYNALRRKNNFGVRFPNCTEIGTGAFRESSLTSAYLPKVTTVEQSAFRNSRLEYSILPALTSMGTSLHESIGAYLLGADYGASAQSTLTIDSWCFYGCPNCNKVVLRYSSVCPLVSDNAFTGSAFANNGSGGTLYVPQSLISSYQSASNWSTILGYANNSIQAIEGSQYENYYVDGTPIS